MNQHNDDSNPGVTIRELADAMGVAYQTVHRWIQPGDMPVMRWDIVSGRRFARLDMNPMYRMGAGQPTGALRGGPWRLAARLRRHEEGWHETEATTWCRPAGSPSMATEALTKQRRQDNAPAWAKDHWNDHYVAVMIAAVVARTRLKELRYEDVRSRLLDRAEAEHW